MSSLDVACINPFVAAAQNLFSSMAKIDVIPSRPRLMPKGVDLSRVYEIAVCVELSGPTEGVIGVILSLPVACALASALAGTTFTTVDADCRDALGEVANMLVGQAKAKLPGGTIKMSLPRVVPTQDLVFPPKCPVILVPFETPCGRFIIAIGCRTTMWAAPVPEPDAATPVPAVSAVAEPPVT
jgi:chemotaxis protein CheX